MKYILITLMAYVCNLGIYEAGSYTSPASGPSVANGSIFVAALDGDGLIPKFNLNADFDYSSGGQTSGSFTGLVPGSYTVFVRTNNTCLKTIVMVVEWVLTYNPLYRIQFYDDRNDPTEESFHFRFDIEDSEYAGAVNELEDFGPEPIVLTWRGESEDSPFKAVISSELTCTLLAKTDHQFIDLFTTNDNRFRGRLFREIEGDWVLVWVGYLTPQLYSSPYDRKENYYNTFVFTDGLADLATVSLSDDGGNTLTSRLSVYDLIQMVLKKTRIELPIWETFTVYDDGMDKGVLDSPLQQMYIDPRVHLNDDGTALGCLTVLDRELLPIGCRLVQANGHWQIDHIPKKAASTVKTRKYAFGGGTISEDDEVYRVMLRRGVIPGPRYAFVEKTGKMDICTQAGKLTTVYDQGLEKVNNLLKDGSFEDEDIENGQLKNWQVDASDAIIGGQPLVLQIEDIPNSEGNRKALKVPFSLTSGITTQQVVLLYSAPVQLFSSVTKYDLKFSFDTLVRTAFIKTDKYVFLDYSIAFVSESDTYYMGYSLDTDEGKILLGPIPGDQDELIDGKYHRVYIDEDGEWKNISKVVTISPDNFGGGSTPDFQVQITFRLSCNPIFDVIGTGSGGLQDVPTFGSGDFATRTFNNRRRVKSVEGLDTFIRTYELEGGTEASDFPNVIVPDDNSTMVWKLKNTVISPQLAPLFYECWAKDVLLDNVQIAYLPNQQNPENEIRYEYTINARNKVPVTIDVIHGDLPNDSNYRSITKGWYSLPDGTPTHRWNQNHPLPSAPFTILQLLQNWYFGHHYVKRWKLSGDFDFDGVLPAITDTIYEVMTGRIYLPMAMEVSLRSRIFRCEMIEILAGEAQVDEGDPDPAVEPPIDVSEHSSEFTDEFA